MWCLSSRIYLDLTRSEYWNSLTEPSNWILMLLQATWWTPHPRTWLWKKEIGQEVSFDDFRVQRPPISLSPRFHRCSLGSHHWTHFVNSTVEVHVPIAFFCSYAAVIFLCNDCYSQSEFAVFDIIIKCDIFNYTYLHFFLNSVDIYLFICVISIFYRYFQYSEIEIVIIRARLERDDNLLLASDEKLNFKFLEIGMHSWKKRS